MIKLSNLLGDRFIDPYLLFCEDGVCRLLSDSGDLLLYDGFHLSREGVIYFSSKLTDAIWLIKNER